MIQKKFIEMDAEGRVFNELEYNGQVPPVAGPELTDVTDRQDGPFIGKIYDPETDTFSDPPEEAPED